MKNRDLLYAVCNEIRPLLNRLVLVGGCATELLVTDKAAPLPRPTQDVDMVVEVVNLADYYQLENQLRLWNLHRRKMTMELYVDGQKVS